MTSDFSTYHFKFESDGSATVQSTGIGVLYFGMWNLVKAIHNESHSYEKATGEIMIIK